MLPHLDRISRRQVQREDVPGAIARERDFAWPTRLRHEDIHPGNRAPEGAFQGLHADRELW